MPQTHAAHRAWLLLALTALWLWAASEFAPWAPDPAPRLWLYDTLYYARFALGAWWLAEAGLLLARRRIATAAVVGLGLGLVAVTAAWGLRHTGPGLRLLTGLSAAALDRARAERARHGPVLIAADDHRRRVGAFLVDTWRLPCAPDQPWLWLGRPFGAGSGHNRALVYGGAAVPYSPDTASFRFLYLHGGWWLAYQNPRAWFRPGGHAERPVANCLPGEPLDRHAEGLRFIADGRSFPG